MAKETVTELYTKLGLDISSLESDFALAGKTVDKAMSRLNHENKKIKIETDISLAGLDEGKDRLKTLDIQAASLNRQLEIQRQKLQLTAATYREVVLEKGRDSAASARLETRLLNERKAYANLEAQIRRTQRARTEGTAGNRMVNSIINGASAMSVITQGASDIGALSMLTSPVGKALGVVTAVGAGALAAAKSAMTAGNAIYELAQKMHTTNAEAAKMSLTFKMAGADANSAVPALIRLDKTIQSGGESGARMTAILSAYGVSLRDANGNMLPLNQQLLALAQGYRNAAAAGLENEYVTQTLGSRGAELVPVLSQMYEIQSRMVNLPTTGLLDPNKAHEMMLDWREMQIEMNQVTGSLGAALLPVVQEILPKVNDGIKELTEDIRDNKETIKTVMDIVGDTGEIVMDVAGIWKEAFPPVTDGLKDVAGLLKDVDNGLKDIKKSIEDVKEASPGLSAISEYMPTPVNMARFARWAYRKARGLPENEEEQPEAAKESPKEIKGTTQDAETTRRQVEEATHQKGKAAATPSVPDISSEIYKATHNDLQNQLHGIDLRAEKLRKEGVEEAQIVALTEAQKAKVYKDFNNNVISQIDSSWKSELQNRLDDIEREKQAWIEKGVSEVKATEWAEHEKTKARQQEALSMFRENRKYLDIMRKAMAGPGSMTQKINNARVGILMAMRQKLGIENDRTSPEEVGLFSNIMNSVKNNLMPGLESESWARRLEESTIPVVRGSHLDRDVPGVSPSITTNITIEGGVYSDNEMVKNMTNEVADRVNRAVTEAARQSNFSYDMGG